MQQYDRLKTHYCVVSVLTLFIVIAASRPVNKNVSSGAVIRAKRDREPGVHKLLANYQTGSYQFRPIYLSWRSYMWYTITTHKKKKIIKTQSKSKLEHTMIGWNGRIGSPIGLPAFRLWTHSLNPLKRDDRGTRLLNSKQCTINQCTHGCLKKTHVRVFFDLFFWGAFCG